MMDGEDITALAPQARVRKGMGFRAADQQRVHLHVGGGKPRDGGLSSATMTFRAPWNRCSTCSRSSRKSAASLPVSCPAASASRWPWAARLMTKPKVLMLDEPTAGVSPIVMDELFDRIIEIARTGIAILMVEQNAKQALNIADKGYVLVQGENRYTDTGAKLLADPEVRRAFLGG
jgi:branched-chain amino acid transport system ATP-binding protein